MKKCDSYHVETERHYLTDFEKGLYVGRGEVPPKYVLRDYSVCWGTRECDQCGCGGDRTKCDFYDDVRTEAKDERIKQNQEKLIEELSTKYAGLKDRFLNSDAKIILAEMERLTIEQCFDCIKTKVKDGKVSVEDLDETFKELHK